MSANSQFVILLSKNETLQKITKHKIFPVARNISRNENVWSQIIQESRVAINSHENSIFKFIHESHACEFMLNHTVNIFFVCRVFCFSISIFARDVASDGVQNPRVK